MIWIFGPHESMIRGFMHSQGILFIRGVVKIFTPSTFHEGLRFDSEKDAVYILEHTPKWMVDAIQKLTARDGIDVTLGTSSS